MKCLLAIQDHGFSAAFHLDLRQRRGKNHQAKELRARQTEVARGAQVEPPDAHALVAGEWAGHRGRRCVVPPRGGGTGPGPAAEVFEVGEMADPEPGSGEVRVRVAVSGVKCTPSASVWVRRDAPRRDFRNSWSAHSRWRLVRPPHPLAA